MSDFGWGLVLLSAYVLLVILARWIYIARTNTVWTKAQAKAIAERMSAQVKREAQRAATTGCKTAATPASVEALIEEIQSQSRCDERSYAIGWNGSRQTIAAAQRGNRSEQPAPVSDQVHTQVLEVVGSQFWQYGGVNRVVAKRLFVLLHVEALEPVGDVHTRLPAAITTAPGHLTGIAGRALAMSAAGRRPKSRLCVVQREPHPPLLMHECYAVTTPARDPDPVLVHPHNVTLDRGRVRSRERRATALGRTLRFHPASRTSGIGATLSPEWVPAKVRYR